MPDNLVMAIVILVKHVIPDISPNDLVEILQRRDIAFEDAADIERMLSMEDVLDNMDKDGFHRIP